MKPRLAHLLLLVALFAAAIAIRIYDLNDPPFDFHPTRQFFTAIVARGEYYQGLESAPEWMRTTAVARWRSEETDFPSMDLLAAWTYRLIGHEDLFFPRLYAALFWVLGGLPIYLIARRMSSPAGGVAALVFYLFAPYGVIASRSFQPDPLMFCLVLFAWWCMLRWKDSDRWGWALAAGALSGLAMLVKALAAFPLVGGMLGVFLAFGARRSLRNARFWGMGITAAVPMLIWIVYGFFGGGELGSQFSLRFFPSLWIDPLFYLRSLAKIETVAGLLPFILGLMGVFFFEKKETRIFLVCLWGSYALYALLFAYYFMTHDYYHLGLVPTIALSLAALADWLAQRWQALKPGVLARLAMGLILLAGLAADLWDIRQVLHKADGRAQAAMLEHIGQVVGANVSATALSADYGYPLFYYSWIPANYWPYTGDARLRDLAGMSSPEFSRLFDDLTADKQYFIITDLAELELQSDLKTYLAQHYPIYDQGTGYLIYDLLHPIGDQ